MFKKLLLARRYSYSYFRSVRQIFSCSSTIPIAVDLWRALSLHLFGRSFPRSSNSKSIQFLQLSCQTFILWPTAIKLNPLISRKRTSVPGQITLGPSYSLIKKSWEGTYHFPAISLLGASWLGGFLSLSLELAPRSNLASLWV